MQTKALITLVVVGAHLIACMIASNHVSLNPAELIEDWHILEGKRPNRTDRISGDRMFDQADLATSTSGVDSNFSNHPSGTLRICNVPRLDLKDGEYKNISFQCDGAAYSKFANNLTNLLMDSSSTTWGRRQMPFHANGSVLFLGNSHTRQLLESFLCQYRDLIDYGWAKSVNHNSGYVKLKNNSTISWLTNSWTAFSTDWATDISKELPRQPSLNSFDAIIVGQFNPIKGKSKYVEDMRNKSLVHSTMDLEREPISLLGIAEVVSNKTSLIGIPMFNVKGIGHLQTIMETSKTLRSKFGKRVYTIDSRRYIETLGECGAASQYEVNSCLNTKAAKRQLHKCAGHLGGFADATSWDLAEVLHEALPKISA